jgi:hypothetical protein
LLKEPIRQCFEKSSELLLIDGLQNSRVRDQSVAPAIFDIYNPSFRRAAAVMGSSKTAPFLMAEEDLAFRSYVSCRPFFSPIV